MDEDFRSKISHQSLDSDSVIDATTLNKEPPHIFARQFHYEDSPQEPGFKPIHVDFAEVIENVGLGPSNCRQGIRGPKHLYFIPEESHQKLKWSIIPKTKQGNVQSDRHVPLRWKTLGSGDHTKRANPRLCQNCQGCVQRHNWPTERTAWQGPHEHHALDRPNVVHYTRDRLGCIHQPPRLLPDQDRVYQDVDVASSSQASSRKSAKRSHTDSYRLHLLQTLGLTGDSKTLLLLFDILALANLVVGITHWFSDYDTEPSYRSLTITAIAFILVSAFKGRINKNLSFFPSNERSSKDVRAHSSSKRKRKSK